MALSNWDTIAFDSDGKCGPGSFKNPKNGAEIEIYKNWAYLHSPSKKSETDYQYTGDTISQIDSGEISILGLVISAARHDDQDAIFIYAQYSEDRGESAPKGERFVTHRFGGIGCYGFKDRVIEVLNKLGREIKDGDHWMAGFTSAGDSPTVYHISNYRDGKVEEVVYHDEAKDGPYNYENDWVGVKPETLEAFFKWLEEREDPEYNKKYFAWVKSCRDSDKLRYNQGDAFFAEHLDLDLPTTKVGESEAPILTKAFSQKDK